MAGPVLFMDAVADAKRERIVGLAGTTTKFLWRPSFYIVMGAPSATGSFAQGSRNDFGGYNGGKISVPIYEARTHFRQQYDKLYPWAFLGHDALLQNEIEVEQGSAEWRALRRTFALFSFDDYLEVLEFLSTTGVSAITFSLDLDTARKDVEAAYLEAEEKRLERVEVYNRILNLLGDEDLQALISTHVIDGLPSWDDEYCQGIEFLRWMVAQDRRQWAFKHPLLTEEEIEEASFLLG